MTWLVARIPSASSPHHISASSLKRSSRNFFTIIEMVRNMIRKYQCFHSLLMDVLPGNRLSLDVLVFRF